MHLFAPGMRDMDRDDGYVYAMSHKKGGGRDVDGYRYKITRMPQKTEYGTRVQPPGSDIWEALSCTWMRQGDRRNVSWDF